MWENQDGKLATNENTRKRKIVSTNSSTRQECIDLLNDNVDDKSDKNYERFTGLVNLKNDCWLNCLLQCFITLYLYDVSC